MSLPASQLVGKGAYFNHTWKNVFTSDVGSAPAPYKFARYECVRCLAIFNHYYDVTPNVAEELRKSNVPLKCLDIKKRIDERRVVVKTTPADASDDSDWSTYYGTHDTHTPPDTP